MQILIALGGMIAMLVGTFAGLVGIVWLAMAAFRHVPLVPRPRRDNDSAR